MGLDIWLPGGPPLFGRLLVPCPFRCTGFILVPLLSACVMLPIFWAVDLHTSCLCCVSLSETYCGCHIVFARLPYVVGQNMVGIVQDTLLTLQVSDDAHSLGIVALWSLVSHNSPFGKNDSCLGCHRC